MSYQEKLSCQRKKCASELTIPIKVILKGRKLIDVAKCPKCNTTYKFSLPLIETDQWLPLIGKSFFRCYSCGTMNDESWIYAGGSIRRIKIVIRCKNCHKKRAKVISRTLWDNITAAIKKPAKPPIHVFKKPVTPPISKPIIKEVKPPISKPLAKKITPPAPKLKCPDCGKVIVKGKTLCDDCKKKQQKKHYNRLFICRKCKSPQVAVQKIKADYLSLVKTHIKCSKCGKSTHFNLPFPKIHAWISNLAQSFFRCVECGSTCKIMKSLTRNNIVQVSLYCEKDWIETQKEIPASLFQVIMTQIQKPTI